MLDSAPAVVQPLRHLRCCDGDAVTFECRFTCPPETAGPLQVRWQRGGKVRYLYVYLFSIPFSIHVYLSCHF